MKKWKGFPKYWALIAKLNSLSFWDKKIEFKEHLPGCIGFVSTEGETVFYGEQYNMLCEEGRIAF